MAETIKATATKRQAIFAVGETEACVNKDIRFWNLTSRQERGAVVPYADPKKSLGAFAPPTLFPIIQAAIDAMNTDSRFMVLFRLARHGDKHILEFKYGEPNLARNEDWVTYTDAAGIKCECHKRGSCNARVQHVVVSKSATKGHVLHELMHVLGFQHEHQLTQRDMFVCVNPQEILANPANYAAGAGVPPPNPRAPTFAYYDPLSIMATHVFTGKTEAQIRQSIGSCEELSAGDVRALGCQYGPYNVADVCTYAAFLNDNMCEHESYCLPTAKDQKICKFCVGNCYTGEMFEESEGPRGFVCACKNRDQHVQDKYETLMHELVSMK